MPLVWSEVIRRALLHGKVLAVIAVFASTRGGCTLWSCAHTCTHAQAFVRVHDCLLGMPADPFQSDETFVTCVLLLEEIGASGNKVHSRSIVIL